MRAREPDREGYVDRDGVKLHYRGVRRCRAYLGADALQPNRAFPAVEGAGRFLCGRAPHRPTPPVQGRDPVRPGARQLRRLAGDPLLRRAVRGIGMAGAMGRADGGVTSVRRAVNLGPPHPPTERLPTRQVVALDGPRPSAKPEPEPAGRSDADLEPQVHIAGRRPASNTPTLQGDLVQDGEHIRWRDPEAAQVPDDSPVQPTLRVK
jgi:hypothetical protein